MSTYLYVLPRQVDRESIANGAATHSLRKWLDEVVKGWRLEDNVGVEEGRRGGRKSEIARGLSFDQVVTFGSGERSSTDTRCKELILTPYSKAFS